MQTSQKPRRCRSATRLLGWSVARRWAARLGRPAPWPDELDEWLQRCHAAGQPRPTPLLLRYGPGDWNALHRDLYGDLVLPTDAIDETARPSTLFVMPKPGVGDAELLRAARAVAGDAALPAGT